MGEVQPTLGASGSPTSESWKELPKVEWVVYKAEDERLGRVVALKVVRDLESDETSRRRFWQEARTAARMAPPHACRIYDVIDEHGRLILVMEFMERESLAKRLARGPLERQEAAQIVLAILSALEAFHKKISYTAIDC